MIKQKTKRIFVRVSEEEHEKLSSKAEAAGMTVSAFIRDHIDRVRIYNHADKESSFRIAAAMNNSLAALARASEALAPCDCVVTLAYLAAIHRQLNRLNQESPAYACKVLPSRNGNK